MAGLIGDAKPGRNGLMPARLVPRDEHNPVSSINLNSMKLLFVPYTGIRSEFTNCPSSLNCPYLAAINIGYTANGQFIQFLAGNDDSGNYALYHRCCYSGNSWTEWKRLI